MPASKTAPSYLRACAGVGRRQGCSPTGVLAAARLAMYEANWGCKTVRHAVAGGLMGSCLCQRDVCPAMPFRRRISLRQAGARRLWAALFFGEGANNWPQTTHVHGGRGGLIHFMVTSPSAGRGGRGGRGTGCRHPCHRSRTIHLGAGPQQGVVDAVAPVREAGRGAAAASGHLRPRRHA